LTSWKARNYARKKVTELLSLAEILAKNDPGRLGITQGKK